MKLAYFRGWLYLWTIPWENLRKKVANPQFFPGNVGISCWFPLNPIQWCRVTRNDEALSIKRSWPIFDPVNIGEHSHPRECWTILSNSVMHRFLSICRSVLCFVSLWKIRCQCRHGGCYCSRTAAFVRKFHVLSQVWRVVFFFALLTTSYGPAKVVVDHFPIRPWNGA